MAAKQHLVELRDDERPTLEALTRHGVAPARRIRRARILLMADGDHPDRRIAEAVGCCVATVENLRRRFARDRLGALDDRPRPGAARLLDAKGEAILVEVARSVPPDGRKAWTLRLLADRLVALEAVDAVSEETVRRALKKTVSSPGSSSAGASPR
jgi:transposase